MTLGKWIGFVALIAAAYILWRIRAIVFLFFAAVILAIALNRLVRRFQRSKASRTVAILLTIVICAIVVGGLFAVMIRPLLEQIDQLIDLVPAAIDQIRLLSYRLHDMIPGRMLRNLPNLTDFSRQLQSIANWVMANIYLFFSNSIALILNTLLVIVLALMLLANPQQYRRAFLRGFPSFYRHRADEILSRCETKLVHYVAGIALSMAFIWVTSTIGLLYLDVPLPFVNGLIAGLSAFIPYIGAIASVVPPMLLAFLEEPWKAGAVLLLYIVIQQVEGNLVTPIIMKQQVSLLPATTLALLTAFGLLFGFLGLLLGLPILVVAQTWIEAVVVEDILDRWQAR
ncbi:AI-2E family transporter [Leptolyngbya sp. AN03gr2]|uniref:AI-2E family transporter n=1 Tax=unclassified Leptolyngbya TaxID=2650499 RepID=UPI003D31196B